MLLHNLYVSFSLNGASTNVQVTHTVCSNAASYHCRCWLFELRWQPADGSLSSLARRTQRLWSPNWISHFDHRAVFHFASIRLQWALAQRSRRPFVDLVDIRFLSLHRRVSACICGRSHELCSDDVSFDDIIYCREWNPQILCNFIPKLLHCFPARSVRVVNPSTHCLSEMLFLYPIMLLIRCQLT